jgi:hypothetical protein
VSVAELRNFVTFSHHSLQMLSYDSRQDTALARNKTRCMDYRACALSTAKNMNINVLYAHRQRENRTTQHYLVAAGLICVGKMSTYIFYTCQNLKSINVYVVPKAQMLFLRYDLPIGSMDLWDVKVL